MATKHWVRDVRFSDPTHFTAGGNHMEGNLILYHFLRVAGWSWLWECDGEISEYGINTNHVVDGNVQSAGVGNWTAYNGAAISKDPSVYHSGDKSLKVVSGGVGEGVTSDALIGMTTPNSFGLIEGNALSGPVNGEMTLSTSLSHFDIGMVGANIFFSGHIDDPPMGVPGALNNDGEFLITRFISDTQIRFYNPSGVPYDYFTPPFPYFPVSSQIRPLYELVIWGAANENFDVEVDDGSGLFSGVGVIPDNGSVFTMYRFQFSAVGPSWGYSPIKIRFLSQGAGTLYVGGISVHRSLFEMPSLLKEGTDGILTNPDEFSTAGSYTPGQVDVGKHLFVWDPTNNANSGCYVILTDLGGGSVQLNLRSGSASFVTQSGLTWRIAYLRNVRNTDMPDWHKTAGFGLESPHSSSWRWFLRQNQGDVQSLKSSEMWLSPEDTDFDVSSGHFYKNGPSVMRSRARVWNRQLGSSGINEFMHTWRGPYSYVAASTVTRTFIMTDEDCSFFIFVHYDSVSGYHGCHLNGYLGSDAQHPGIMACFQFARWEEIGSTNEIYMDGYPYRFGGFGTGFDERGLAQRATLGQLGYGGSIDSVLKQTNAKANPFSGKEWAHSLFVGLDPERVGNAGGEMDSNCGVYQCRLGVSADLSTFDSDQYLHISSGLIIEWMGETLL